MSGRALILRAAEQALLRDEPLAEVLERAGRLYREQRALEDALNHSRAGDLPAAMRGLERLGADPVVAQVAGFDPRAAGATSRRLAGLPRFGVLAEPFVLTGLYLTVVAGFQVAVVALLRGKVLRMLEAIAGPTSWMDLLDAAGPLFQGAWALWIALGAVLLSNRGRWLLPGVHRHLRAARLLTAAAELARHAPHALSTFASRNSPTLPPVATFDAAALDALVQTHLSGAVTRAARAARRLRVAGTTLLVAYGLLVLVAIYGLLPVLHTHVE